MMAHLDTGVCGGTKKTNGNVNNDYVSPLNQTDNDEIHP